ncbi:hypothetical protein KSP39_PZI023243 [Platanthera zijinensis]|uniref:DUF7731 domain-containing protein n=1 Tax=Platanthera zijinensis TaxID=2320716 RepID=A0AAP0AWH0_9ASPA
MASSPLPRTLLILVVISISTGCTSEPDAVDILTKARACFDDPYVYISCQNSYRLRELGSIDIPADAVDEYCGGPCLKETKLVLMCLHNTFDNFRFYNGRTLRDVGYALDRGCSLGMDRGDFSSIGLNGGDCYHDYGKKTALSIYLYLFLVLI